MTSETGSLSVQRMHENAETLRSALSEALQFSPNKAASLVVSDAQINGFVDEEVSFGRVSVDSNGLTAGMRRHLLPPAQSLLASWAQAKGAFVTAIQPFMSDIDAVDSLDGEIQELKKRREADVEQIKREARSDRNYVHLEQDWDKKKKAFEDRHYRVGQRKVTMAAYNPLYWVAMLSTLAAEWLINYDTFYIFMGVPAIAAGTTIILGAPRKIPFPDAGAMRFPHPASFGGMCFGADEFLRH
jgi:hypothetical protein